MSKLWDDFVEGTISNVTLQGDYKNLMVEIYKKNCKPQYHEKEVYRVFEGRIYSLSNEINHLCTRFCKNHPTWCSEKNLTTQINDVYISNHMNVHFCCPNCDAKKEFSDGFETCTISGLRYQSQDWVNSYKRLHEYHRTSSTTVRVETSVLRQCAKKLIHKLLFSETRLKAERKKIFDLQKDIHKHWIKHKRSMDKKKQIVNVMDLFTVAANMRQKKISKKYVLPDAETQELITSFYESRICEFYLKLRSLTNFSVHNNNNNVSTPFCCAILFTMRSGLYINSFPVISKDYFLHICLPEANTIDTFGVHKSHFSTLKNNISAAIRDSVHMFYVNPNKLMLCSLQEE